MLTKTGDWDLEHPVYNELHGIKRYIKCLKYFDTYQYVMDKTNFYFFRYDRKNLKIHENPPSSDKHVWSGIKHRLLSSL